MTVRLEKVSATAHKKLCTQQGSAGLNEKGNSRSQNITKKGVS